VLWGSVAPDLPFYTLSALGYGYYRGVLGWGSEAAFRWMHGELYFHHPFWIAAHSLLHAPVLVGLALALLWRFRDSPDGAGRWWFWFFAAGALHSAVDILTHYDDGPLLLFPFDWHTRFHSLVSYWDPAHRGRQFFVFEIALDVLLLIYLWTKRKEKREKDLGLRDREKRKGLGA
jgi:membrane-bound metal-dependent hydrolase YbcI (DUF457 family)